VSLSVEQKPDLEFGGFRILRSAERLIGPQGPIKLGNKAMCVLILLAEHPGDLITKEILFSSVWDGTIVSESALTSVIKELRKALGDESRAPRFIESVYGRGYRFLGEVRPAERPAPAVEARPALPTAPQRQPSRRDNPPLVLVAAFNDDAIRQKFPHLAAGLREEVLSGLARFREIRLVADARPDAAPATVSDRDYQLSAMLLPDGDHAKIIVRAKRLGDGRIVWAETMALSETGNAGGVEKIVRRIAGAALPALDEDIVLGLPDETEDLYDRYLIARYRGFHARDHAEARAAAESLEHIIAERPGFGLAYAPLARLYNIDFGYTALGSTGPAERARALELAKTGLAADRANVNAYTALGFCHLWHGEFGLARDILEQALALNPYNPTRLNEVASGMMHLGDFERAHHLFDMSVQLQPHTDDYYLEDRIQLAFHEGKPELIPDLCRRLTRPMMWAGLYEALADEGDLAKGEDSRFAAWLDRIEQRWPGGTPPGHARIEQWIHFHHPMEPANKPAFEARVRAGFAALDE